MLHASDQAAGLRDAKMQRAIDCFGELLVGGDSEKHVARFHRDLIFVKVMVLQEPDMVERAFDQRLGAGLAIFFEQILLQAAGVHPDADRAAIGLGGVHHFLHPLRRADIAGIDPQAGRARIGRFQRALIVEMDVRDDGNARRTGDLAQRRGRLDVGAGDADDVGAGFLAAADLIDRRARIAGRGVGHRLHGDGRVAAHRRTEGKRSRRAPATAEVGLTSKRTNGLVATPKPRTACLTLGPRRVNPPRQVSGPGTPSTR